MLITHQVSESGRFRFPRLFLAPYYEKGDPFRSLLSRSTYLTKYCREGEVWTSTIQRVVEASVNLAPRHVERREAQMLFHLFWTGQVLPPGRSLWVGGIDGIPADARFNCFAKETRFWANGVLTTFEEAVGQTVEVLAKDGRWRPAEVKSFGVQKLLRYRMKPPGRTNFAFEFSATENHRWFTSNRGEVTDLKVGDRILVSPTPVESLQTSERDKILFEEGFAHGIVFGDGSRETLKPGVFRIRLCAEKDRQHQARLEKVVQHTNTCTPPSCNGDPVLFFRSDRNWKDLPGEDAPLSYQAGFLAGWLAADGSIRLDGRGGNRLASQNGSALDWVVERAPFLGYCVTGRSLDPSTETNFGSRSSRLEILTLRNEPVEYTVREIVDEGREEETFCVTEPETGSFTLEGGVVTGNCWYTTLHDVDDWCWVANQLMLGGGVGVGLAGIGDLPVVEPGNARFAVWCADSHPNWDEVKPQDRSFLNGQTPVLRVADSREGWVEAIRATMLAAFHNRDQIVDVSDVRPRGAPIRTFGGIAAGPGPLVQLLRASWEIIRSAAGRKLSSVDCLDITNHVGLCIKAGNVRRSALIVLGDADDQAFRDAKKDFQAVLSHRHTSNNSIAFQSWEQIRDFDWQSLANDVVDYGEPGILNLPLARRTDPNVTGVNPCGEQCLEDRESCNLAEAFPARFEGQTDPDLAFRLLTRYAMRQRLTPLTDPRSREVGERNNRIGVGLGGICDFEWDGPMLARWFDACRHEADEYAVVMGVNAPITTTTVKPSGTISLLNDSSPGIHAPYAPYYIRRTRHAKNDPLVPALIEAGVPYEQDVYDKTGNTLVFSFPSKALHTRHTVVSETLRDQFERQAAVQEWWADNAVSSTISFEPHEKDQLASLFREFVPKLKSTSVLSKAHGYEQPPYEEIDQETYERMTAGIDHGHQLVHGGDFEIEECRSGVCPIR